MSHCSWLRLPITRVIRRRNARSRRDGHVAQHRALARGRVQQARQHLQGGGLAGAVGAEEADHLARLDVEGDPVDGLHGAVRRRTRLVRAAPSPGVALGHLERLGQGGDVDGGHRQRP